MARTLLEIVETCLALAPTYLPIFERLYHADKTLFCMETMSQVKISQQLT